MLGIKAACFSRVSNDRVRKIAGVEPISREVRRAQLDLFGKVLMNPDKKGLRGVAFHDGSYAPVTAAFVRRVGRPRQMWTDQLL